MDLQRKLEILADAAKYDASCASSGTEQRDSRDGKGLGSTAPGMGICHSYAPDGRCISLLKILLTNACNYDCLYCVNRASSNVPRAGFTVDEVVQLTLDFYRRRHPEEPRSCAASRRTAAGACGHPSRLAVKNGEHLRMTSV
jgi:predicted DNA-binding helix-hairpin-helix protein